MLGSWLGWGKLAGESAAQPGHADACLGGRDTLQHDLPPWAPAVQLAGEHRAPLWPVHPCILPREKGSGQGRWMLLILGEVGICCLHSMVYMELLKSTGHCVPTAPVTPHAERSFPRKQMLGASCRCNQFFPGPFPLLCCAGPYKELMGMEWEKGPLHPDSHHPTCPGEGSAQYLYTPAAVRLWRAGDSV